MHVGDGRLVVRRAQARLPRRAAEDLGAVERPQRLSVDRDWFIFVRSGLRLEGIINRPREAVLVVLGVRRRFVLVVVFVVVAVSSSSDS